MGELQLEISRPFRLGGFATGDYMCKCMTCGGEFTGDKRAMTCLPCVADRINAARSEAQPSDGGKSLGERPIRPDLAIGAITVAMKTTTDGEVGPWLQTALDFLTGEYEPLDDAALTFTARLSDANPSDTGKVSG